MRSADNDPIDLMGAIFLELSGDDEYGTKYSTNQMVYISRGSDEFYLNRSACKDLGIISEDFPVIGEHFSLMKNAVAKHDASPELAPCGCPKRSMPPPITNLPCDLIDSNRKILEDFLLKHFKSSTFNTCTHQPLPEMHGPPMKLIVDRNAKPVATHKAIPVPVHFQKPVKEGLDSDVRLEVIEPVPSGTPTTWLHPMVICSKKDGNPRRTVDFTQLNKHAARETHHTPSPYQLAREVPCNKKKTTLDAWNGYHGIRLHKSDHHLTTFITPWGRYRYLRCPQGYIASGDAYTSRYDAIITDVQNKVKCVDDTLLWASTTAESFEQTVQYLELCGRNGIILNPKKFNFAKDEVEFAGFQITKNSVAPIPTFTKAIENFPKPQSITDIRSWFGLVNQSAYCFSKTEIMKPFRDLLKKGSQFKWTDALNESFEAAKSKIIMEIKKGVKIYDKNRRTCLATDWSKTGIGAWLLQKHCRCDSSKPFCCKNGWQVTLFASRYLTEAESRYAPVEGELLAVVFGLEKCKHFVLGCTDLIIAVDHKPLIGLLTKRSLEDIPNSRLRNLKEKTQPFRFQISHVDGVRNRVADCLSRSPSEPAEHLYLPDDTETPEETQTVAAINESPSPAITLDIVANYTISDPIMRNLLQIIEEGFPPHAINMPEELRVYHKYRDSLSSRNGLVTYNDRVVIPIALRSEALKTLHAAHQGISSMNSRAKKCIFWPGITNDIKKKRDSCLKCHRIAPSQPNAPPQQPTVPEYPFQLICADYFEYRGSSYLIIVDRYSGWPIVKKTQDGAAGLITALRDAMNTFGFPEELSSDGGPEFRSESLKKALNIWGILQRTSSVAHAQSNGRAEVGVKSMKRLLMDNTGSSGNLNNEDFLRAILQYRNTPLAETGIAPAVYIFHRPIRDFLPDINLNKPQDDLGKVIALHQESRENQLSKHQPRLNEHTRRLQQLHVGDKVFVQNQTGPSPTKWDYTGVIIEVKQFDQYMVKMDHSGRHTLRNRKYLRLWKIPDESLQHEKLTHQILSSNLIPNSSESQPVTLQHPDPMPHTLEQDTPPQQEIEQNAEIIAPNENDEPEALTRRSQRIKKPPDRLTYNIPGHPE